MIEEWQYYNQLEHALRLVAQYTGTTEDGKLFDAAAKAITVLRGERDEARRFYCRMQAKHAPLQGEQNATDVAVSLNWDCFERGVTK